MTVDKLVISGLLFLAVLLLIGFFLVEYLPHIGS